MFQSEIAGPGCVKPDALGRDRIGNGCLGRADNADHARLLPASCVPQDLARLPIPYRARPFFFSIGSKAMHAAKPLTVNDHVVTYLAANDPPPMDWLEGMGWRS